ncbi:hypothetical protein, partial [Arcobacter sp. CECT 8985]|uniref:hypothetical protein n=1 Tax=Arcobacter sp. CECT 8985 TaxID=1935424 RepID=UPI001026AD62
KIHSNIIKPFNFPNLLLFFLIISISLSCLSYLSFFNNEKKIEKKSITHISLYKYKAQKLVNILEVLKNYDLNLDELSFENNQFNLFVSSININNIHKFIDSKIYKIDVVSLNYNNQRQKNELVCKISSL